MLLLYDKYICFESDSIFLDADQKWLNKPMMQWTLSLLLLIKWLKIYHGYENHIL